MSHSIGSASSSNFMSSLHTQMANRQRPDLRKAANATPTQAKSEIKNTSGVDVDAAARKVDTDGDRRLTTSELAAAASKQLTTAVAKLDTNGDGKVTRAEVRSKLEQANKDRDTNGDGKVSQQENGAAAARLAEQLDSQYSGMRLKGLSREEVNSQLNSVNTVGSRAAVMNGVGAYEYSQADTDGNGRISQTEGEDYLANRTGLADDVKRVKARAKTEKTEQDSKAGKSGNADGTSQTGQASQTDQNRQEKRTDTSYQLSDYAVARQMVVAQAYSAGYGTGRSGQLDVSA